MITRMLSVVLTLCISSHASAVEKKVPSENICLTLGKVAAATADFRKIGASEEDAIKTIENSVSNSNKQARRMQRAVAQYVYTMQLDSSDARKTVYLKCKAGDFGD